MVTSRGQAARLPASRTARNSLLAGLLLSAAIALCATSASAHAGSGRSVGTPEQVAWVRRAAGNFVTAELAANGAGACSILAAPLRAESHHRTCAQRWDAKLAAMLRRPGTRSQLRRERGAIASARVLVRGDGASIELPAPLLDSANRFVWSENCWMLAR